MTTEKLNFVLYVFTGFFVLMKHTNLTADSGWVFNDVTIMWALQQKNEGVVKWQITCCYEGAVTFWIEYMCLEFKL
jgi:hypothetical protein